MDKPEKTKPMESLRFGFGKNWQNFLTTLNNERIKEAEKSLLTSLNKKLGTPFSRYWIWE